MAETNTVDWDTITVDNDKTPPKMNRQGKPRSKVTLFIQSLQPGQSFVVPKKAAPNVRVRFRQVHGKNAYREVPEGDESVRFFRKESPAAQTTTT